MNFLEGEIIYINKPLKKTSFDVCGKVRWLLCHQLGIKKLKVGHTGTHRLLHLMALTLLTSLLFVHVGKNYEYCIAVVCV